jgi:hypothetical protein
LIGAQRWENNWLSVSPEGAVPVELQRFAAKRRAQKREVRELPAGTPVVLFGSAPGAIRRCRTFASDAGIELEREYLAFPSARAPGYLVEDAPAPVSAFVKRILVAPPRSKFSGPIRAGLSLLRTLSPWRSIRTIAPGRVVVGRRT